MVAGWQRQRGAPWRYGDRAEPDGQMLDQRARRGQGEQRTVGEEGRDEEIQRGRGSGNDHQRQGRYRGCGARLRGGAEAEGLMCMVGGCHGIGKKEYFEFCVNI